MVSITIHERLETKALPVLTYAREIALRSTEGVVDLEHVLYGISVVSEMGAVPIANALLVAGGLKQTAIRSAIAPTETIPDGAHGRFSSSMESAWERAAQMADNYGNGIIRVTYLLCAILEEVRLNPESNLAKLIAQVSPHLDVQQVLDAIKDLLDATDHTARATEVNKVIATNQVSVNLTKASRSASIREGGGPTELTRKLSTQIEAQEQALKLMRATWATHLYLSKNSA